MSRLANTHSVVEAIIGAPLDKYVMIPYGAVWVWNARDPAFGGGWVPYRTRYDTVPGLEIAEVEALRQDAELLLDSFPATAQHLAALGCDHTDIVHRAIQTREDVNGWAESIYNACFPLPAFERYEPGTFNFVHTDPQGFVVVIPEKQHSTKVVWTKSPTRYTVGAVLGPRHPVSVAAWGGHNSGG